MARTPADDVATDYLLANGIDCYTGRPLDGPGSATGDRLVALAGSASARTEDAKVSARYRIPEAGAQTRGVGASVDDPENLAQAGWGVVFPANVDASRLKEALEPLLTLRREQAGDLFKVFDGQAGVLPGEDAAAWLARQGRGPGLAAVNPAQGVPFYLLIVASPDEIPTSFQYLIDIFWAVGRLHFHALDDYASYAKAIVAYETADTVAQRERRSVMFATEHPFDRATAMFMRDVVNPLLDGTDPMGPLGRKQGFAMRSVLKDEARKAKLLSLLTGDGGGVPSLLVSGTHGMAFDRADGRQGRNQGALVCNDWQGYGSITQDHWFGADDVPMGLRLDGMMHFLFACYGGGWESTDTFRDGPGGRPRIIADRPSVAALPMTFLSRGALCVIAHVDRAWAYSFRTPQGRTQNHPMRDVLIRLMQGKRAGNAIDQFNLQWSALTVPIADALRDGDDPAQRARLERLWIARDDLRNYAILGDPAARIRVDRLAAAA